MSSSVIFGSNSIFGKIDRFTSFGMDVKLDKMLGLTTKPLEAQYQSIGELSQQTAKESEPRAIIWGRVRPIGGNIIHCQKPVSRWLVSYTEVEGGGGLFGGKKRKQETWTQHVYRTYAIGVCEGPITAFARIWRNNKLVYDGRGTAWGAKNNSVFLKKFRLHLGGWDQMPSSYLQAIWGAANVPAYRGTAYMVAVDEELTDQGGAVPQWMFEVERAEGYVLTSKPYAAELLEGVDATASATQVINRELLEVAGVADALNPSAAVSGLALRDLVKVVPIDEALDPGASVTALALRETVKAQALTEAVDASAIPTEISLRTSVVGTDFAAEAVDASASMTSIQLTG